MVSQNIPFLFAALAMAISFSMCCPIGQCVQLPSLPSYFMSAAGHQAPLQAKVNISTRTNPAFQPHIFQSNIRIAENSLPEQTNDCNHIFNVSSQDTGLDTPCPWRYQCDYNPQRIPAVMFSARCNSATPQGSTDENEICREVYFPVTYIVTSSCDPVDEIETTEWKLVTNVLPVSCGLQS